MRIMFLMFSFTVGGTERLVADICNEMSVCGHEVFLYIINDYYSKDLLDTISSNVHVETLNRPIGRGGRFKLIKILTKFIRNNKIDIVHCNSFNSPDLLFLKNLFFKKTKIFLTVHDVGQYKKLSRFRVWLRNKLCEKIISISDCVHEDIIRSGAAKDKVLTIYNALNFERFCKLNNKSLENSGKIILGNVARLIPAKKGQDILLRALAKVKAVKPNIVCKFAGGSDNDEDLKGLQILAEELGVTENVSFVGNVNNVPEFLDDINIFVLPSRYEGFGISLIEAMSLGIPCVASNLDGPKEIINTINCGLTFESEDENDLADKLLFLIDNYLDFKKKALLGVVTIKEIFNIKVMCKKLIAVYIGDNL